MMANARSSRRRGHSCPWLPSLAGLLGKGLAIGLAIGLLWQASPALAGKHDTLRHKVQAGDTIALLAAEYYGDRRHAIFIMVANKMQHDRPLKPGERLKIPVNREVTVAPGDTLESLAETYLGDPRRSVFLADFNELDVDASLAAGEAVQIPFHVQHTAAGKESISAIAAAYFASRKQAKLIRDYNFTRKKTLEAGETVTIPIVHVQVRRSRLPPPDKESQKRVAKRQEMHALALESMQSAKVAWGEGDYATVKQLLTRIDTDYLDRRLAVAVSVLLGSTYVAFNDSDSALATFRKALERSPKHKLETYHVSPRIRTVWQQAGGQIAVTDAP